MCILYGNYVDLFKCMFDFYDMEFEFESVFSSFIDGMWIVALAHATKTIIGATFHPLTTILLMSGWYFVVFLSRVYKNRLKDDFFHNYYTRNYDLQTNIDPMHATFHKRDGTPSSQRFDQHVL